MVSTRTTAGQKRLVSSQAKYGIALGTLAFVVIALVITALRGHVTVGSMDMHIDSVFRIPAPPRDIEWWPTGTYITIAIVGVADVVLIGLGIRDYVKTKSLIPMCIGLASLAYVFPEVFVDVLGGVYMTADHHLALFTIMGRDMGWWIIPAWMSYGYVPYAFYKLLLANPKTKILWWGLLGAGIADVLNEEWLLLFRPYHYYGNQPLILLNLLPWWWIACNSVGAILAASLAYRYRDLLRGWRAGAMFIISPISMLGVYGLIAMPSFMAVNGAYPWLFTQLLGFATLALGVLVFIGIIHLVLERNPFDMNQVPQCEDAEA